MEALPTNWLGVDTWRFCKDYSFAELDAEGLHPPSGSSRSTEEAGPLVEYYETAPFATFAP